MSDTERGAFATCPASSEMLAHAESVGVVRSPARGSRASVPNTAPAVWPPPRKQCIELGWPRVTAGSAAAFLVPQNVPCHFDVPLVHLAPFTDSFR
jgi:hypothetical protein